MGTFQEAIDKTCKLDKPKVTKINRINNSWICKGIIESIHKNDQLYNNLKGSISKKCPSGNENLKSIQVNHQNLLRFLIKKAKNKDLNEDAFKDDPITAFPSFRTYLSQGCET